MSWDELVKEAIKENRDKELMKQNENINVRINSKDLDNVKKIVNVNRDKYANTSHFIRCATILLVDCERLGIIEDVRKMVRKYK